MKKKHTVVDPHRDREKQKYGHPIPSREYILQYLAEYQRPASFDQLARALAIRKSNEKEALQKRLRAMEHDGQLMQNRAGKFCLISKVHLIPGRVEAHHEGYGFLIPADGSADLYLSARQMRSILHGDQVTVREVSEPRNKRREGIIVEIRERTVSTIVGKVVEDEGVLLVQPDNKRIFQLIILAPKLTQGAKPGQIVVCQLISPPELRGELVAKVVEILGEHMAPGMEIDMAIRSFNLPFQWPEKVLKEISSLKPEVSPEEIKGRLDLRHLPFVTIDGEDARDFDDAVYCEKRKRGGYLLYVAIADVSHYVQSNSALDEAAHERGTSVYFPNQVLPMLPEILSNELCSLKPDVDRLSIVCEIQIDSHGEISKYSFHEAVIHSQARLTYTKVAAMLQGDEELQTEYSDVLPHVETLYQLYQLLLKTREIRGAIDFEMRETRIIFDENKKIKKIVPLVRNEAHKLIEECMLVANVCAARFLEKNKMPAPFRVHSPPTSTKINELREFLGEFGLHLHGGDEPSAKDYAELLKKIKTRPDFNLIQTVLLRSLSQAIYSEKNLGHFGLAYDAYTHFTSPIRRYPDLLVHRAIRHLLQKRKTKQYQYTFETMAKVTEHCSITERRADEATRKVVDWLKCEFMQDKVGEEFRGTICGVTNFGIFVELKDVYVEGLVHVTALKNDYYVFDSIRHRLLGERTRKAYRLGDVIHVRVMRVNLDDQKIDFELVDKP